MRQPPTNDWHYVEIWKISNGNFQWKNKANVTWDLIPNDRECSVLEVGKNCPYNSDKYGVNRYTSARFNQSGIYGPFQEFYDYQGISK